MLQNEATYIPHYIYVFYNINRYPSPWPTRFFLGEKLLKVHLRATPHAEDFQGQHRQEFFVPFLGLVFCQARRAHTVYKGLYNWPNETIGKQHKQCP